MHKLLKLVPPVGKCPSDVQEKSEHFNRHFNKHFNMSKADIRTACRKRWGKEWYEVHPLSLIHI